ncbi:hypothetical protein [Sphingobacterium corticibacter]|uniref:DUF5689 domain-containing protein n=1 Tax=Sphingobacterium corticibacter TaxID=2171749 RepID=A0A2T8HJZ9_9SPHI|nr:hypothetical protein [Sphingobacterium corticibacter]PVH25778.1 hypothetical protein DC487_07545 [Sphingobacterium corticibacter]
MRTIYFLLLSLLLSGCTFTPSGTNNRDDKQSGIYKRGELTQSKQILHDYLSKLAFDQSMKKLVLLKVTALDDIDKTSTVRQEAEFEAMMYVAQDCNWLVGLEQAQDSGHPFFVMEYENRDSQFGGIDAQGNIIRKASKYNFKKGMVILIQGYASFKNRGDGIAVESIRLSREFASKEDHGLDIEMDDPMEEQDVNTAKSQTMTDPSNTLDEKEYITQTSKSYFYNSPDVSTKRKAYLEKGDVIHPLKEQGRFYYIEFTSPQSHKTSRGWVLKSDFIIDNAVNDDKLASDYNKVLNLKRDGSYQFNHPFFTKMSNQEKAIIALVAMKGGTDCEYTNDDCTNCQLTDYLQIGCQCSEGHKSYVRKWFNSNKDLEEDIDNCYKTPSGATFQRNIQGIKMKRVENTYLVEVEFLELNIRHDVSEVMTNTYKFAVVGGRITLL